MTPADLLWAFDDTAAPFCPFDLSHLAVLTFLVVLCGSFQLLRHRLSASVRQACRWIMAILLVGNDLLVHLWVYRQGQWSPRSMLPVQLCDLSIYLGAVMLVTRSRRLYEYVYFLGVGGGVPSLLTPDLGAEEGFPQYLFFQYFICHGLIVVAPLYMTLVEGYRPTWKSVIQVIVGVNLYLPCVALLNMVVGGNYLFLCGKPGNPTLFDLLGDWPWYLVSMEVLGLLIVLLLYSPFAIHDWWQPARRTLP
jgi:hypothetical integral membrane protein (TIGR02206 family)